jgi:multisubunit Na+/H+ antiporter MnhB subunit
VALSVNILCIAFCSLIVQHSVPWVWKFVSSVSTTRNRNVILTLSVTVTVCSILLNFVLLYAIPVLFTAVCSFLIKRLVSWTDKQVPGIRRSEPAQTALYVAVAVCSILVNFIVLYNQTVVVTACSLPLTELTELIVNNNLASLAAIDVAVSLILDYLCGL